MGKGENTLTPFRPPQSQGSDILPDLSSKAILAPTPNDSTRLWAPAVVQREIHRAMNPARPVGNCGHGKETNKSRQSTAPSRSGGKKNRIPSRTNSQEAEAWRGGPVENWHLSLSRVLIVPRQRRWDSLRPEVKLHIRTFSSPENGSRLAATAGPQPARFWLAGVLEPAVYSGGPRPGRKGEHAGRKQSRNSLYRNDGRDPLRRDRPRSDP